MVRHSLTSDVLRLREDLAQPTISDMAEEFGLTYAQVWHMLDRRARGSDPDAGVRLRLSKGTVEDLRAEHRRRQVIAANAVTAHQAASLLDLPVTIIGTLIRAGHLELTPGPDQGRGRYVTRASVDRYGTRFPCRPADHGDRGDERGDEGPLLRCTDAARVMGMTRPTLSVMGRTRQVRLVPKKGSRHVYVSAASVRDWAQREGKPEVEAALDRLLRGT